VAVFSEHSDTPIMSVSIEGIGTPEASLIPNGEYGSGQTVKAAIPHHKAASVAAFWWLNSRGIDSFSVRAVGHRVVHGGERYSESVRINDGVVTYLTAITSLAPNHMPVALTCIAEFRNKYYDAAHIACFDTAFFHEVPNVARTLALPRDIRDAGVRRYGFHGLSYEYLLQDFKRVEGEMAAFGRVIIAHLGSGASIAALKDGKPIDMSMGFTPASGIVMSTRTGDIDPGVIDFLIRERSMTIDEVNELLYEKSGLLGLSETTADMHSLLEKQHTDPRAQLAIDIFCYTVKKHIGAYAAALGGVDSIIFSAGIGERSSEVRARSLAGLEFMGVNVSTRKNEANERLISAPHSRVGVHVIPTHEDTVLVQKTRQHYKEQL
jgi:acetate kinase